MLKKWLEVDITASWEKLFTVIESPAVTYSAPNKATVLASKLDQLTITDKGDEAVAILSKRVREVNIQTRLSVDKDAWPPEQPKTFTPLVLIQHQGHRNLKQFAAMTEFVERGHIDEIVSVTSTDRFPRCPKLDSHHPLKEILDTSTVTNNVSNILAPLQTSNDPQFILIEGAPGIGKSLLLKEIAYLWGKQKVLQKFKLVLLVCLRNPAIQQMSFIDDLVQFFCKRDKGATETASACRKYFVKNNDEDLTLLLDSYDEYPDRLREDSLVADTLHREVLPHCGLIVLSRPHASISLRAKATVRVDILGFTEAERQHYIKESMKDQPHKTDELLQYLQSHSTISGLCFVPFNIVVLVYLYKQGIRLPMNSAELYSYFICLTVCRHLTKYGHHLQNNITSLTDLPEPYNKIIQELSKLSLGALNKNKLVFTLDEIKEACPDITGIPEAINGLGLLQAVEHYGLTGTTTTFNFLHFSIQEYLAAHHITNLPFDEELKIIKAKFWSSIHFNMFSIYVAITKGQRPSFKHFLCGGDKMITISDKFLSDQLQCILLYWCFYEAGDVDICKTIERSVPFTFGNKKINLSYSTLTASDIECVTVFLTSLSHKEWVGLDLTSCYIQDHGLHILHRGLLHCSSIIITELHLGQNGLTRQSASLISDITVSCNVKVLVIIANHTIGEDEQLYSILSNPSTMLEQLYMYNIALSSRATIALFNALKNNSTLKDLYIDLSDVTDDVSDIITTALQKNSCLFQLCTFSNSLTGEATISIVNGLKANNTLAVLGLPRCPEDTIKRISSLQEVINKERESQGCHVKLKIDYL